MTGPVFVGIDVSSRTLEVASSGQAQTWQVSNDSSGIERLAAQLLDEQVALVVLEAAGGHEFEVVCTLQAAGLAVAAVDSLTIHDFAHAMGVLDKTHALDARMLAAFARVLHQHPERESFVRPLVDVHLQSLQAHVLRRRQLVQMLDGERQRLRLAHAAARPSIERSIVFLEREIKDGVKEVADHVLAHHAELKQALAAMRKRRDH